MRIFGNGFKGLLKTAVQLAIGIALLYVPHSALAARIPTTTGTVTGTAAGSAQINVSATYSNGASCGGGGDTAPTFEVQWDVAPADWAGFGTSGALTDGDATSPFAYSITTGLTPGQTYAIRVIYTDGNGLNGSCTGGSLTVDGNNVALPVNGLTVVSNSAVVDSSTQITVTATFTGDENADSTTQVEYNTSNSWPGTVKCAAIATGSPRTCVVDSLLPSTQYWIRVTHTDGDGVTGTNPQVIGPFTTQAAATFGCGSCHGTPPVDGDNCDGDARGLHGVHYNYSSTQMKKSEPVTGKCAFCHTATTGYSPTATHNNNYINVTSTTLSPGLKYNPATSTCTDACHKNESSTAKWGNFTSVSTGVTLGCNSCHDDSAAGSMNLSGGHGTHLTTGVTTGTALDGAGNAKCAACHPDNVNDLWSQGKADDGSVKAYPHASDGTNVATDNATINAGLGASRNAGATDTCASACHGNLSTDVWNSGSLACSSCHNTFADAATNDAAVVKLGGSHSAHFSAGKTCSNCHNVPSLGDMSHITSLPVTVDSATVTLAAGTFTDATNTCSNTGTGCHLTGSVVWGTTLSCDSCHNYPGSNNWAAGNGHAVQLDTALYPYTHLPLASNFNASGDTYAAVTADTTKCGKCHSGGTHNNGVVNVTAIGNNYCGAGNFTVNVIATGTNVSCSNVACHSGRTTPNWW